MFTGLGQSGLQRPVVSNSCALNNKWCIHKLQKQRLFRGCKVCAQHDERLTFLLFHSEGGEKELNSVRGTGCHLSCRKTVEIKRPQVPFTLSSNRSWV